MQKGFSWTAQWDANVCEFMCKRVTPWGNLHRSHSQSNRP